MFNNSNSTNPHNVDNNSPYRMKKDTVKIITIVIVAILSLLIDYLTSKTIWPLQMKYIR